jgi:preprotein translocase subunit SecE
MTMRITTSIVIVAACISFIALLWAPELGLTWLVAR